MKDPKDSENQSFKVRLIKSVINAFAIFKKQYPLCPDEEKSTLSEQFLLYLTEDVERQTFIEAKEQMKDRNLPLYAFVAQTVKAPDIIPSHTEVSQPPRLMPIGR